MNILVSMKKLLSNKNTVTIIGVILIIVILYFGYNYQVTQAITPIKNIPVAKVTIQPRTEITKDMISYIDVVPAMLKGTVYRSSGSIIGKYTNYNTMIPQGSMFFNGAIISKEELPDNVFANIKDGNIPYTFPVTTTTTYGNSIMPGNYIDIYMKAKDDNGKLVVGKLVENIEVLAVKDSVGKNVFENTDEDRVPSMLIFGVTTDINILLKKGSYMSEYSVVLFPVPHGGTAAVEGGEIQVSTAYLKDFINSHTVVIDEESGEEVKETDDTEDTEDNTETGE